MYLQFIHNQSFIEDIDKKKEVILGKIRTEIDFNEQ